MNDQEELEMLRAYARENPSGAHTFFKQYRLTHPESVNVPSDIVFKEYTATVLKEYGDEITVEDQPEGTALLVGQPITSKKRSRKTVELPEEHSNV